MARLLKPKRSIRSRFFRFLFLFASILMVFVIWVLHRSGRIKLSSHFWSPINPTPAMCVQPVLDINDPVMMKMFKKIPPVKCEGQKDLVYVENGTLRYSAAKLEYYQCDMHPLYRGPGDYKISFGHPLKNVEDKAPLVTEFFKIKCTNGSKEVYENVHLGVHPNPALKERLRKLKPPDDGLGLSVVMLGFDSMSRMSWLRRMPRTRNYFVTALGAVELEGYNIMGDGTPAALLPILTGKHEQELPEARRNKKGARSVDGFPWLWKDFQRNGYLTSWADAEVSIAPFNYRLLGFEQQPTDFFMRPYYLAVNPTYSKYTSGCQASVSKHQIWFNFVRDIHYMYKEEPKFLFHFYATLSHDDNNPIGMADDDLYHLLNTLETEGYLNNTLLVLFADHGARYFSVRGTLSGKLEERMPYFSIRLPSWFHKKHPDLVANLKTNAKRLTTPMDVHETLKDILHFSGGGAGSTKNRGISLFKEIPKNRTCGHADIAPHWCSCLSWRFLDPESTDGKRAIKKSLDTINGFTADYRLDCAELKVENVTAANQIQTSDSILKFKQTTGDRGLKPIMSDKNVKLDKILYQLTFFTAPGDGQFEVTVEHSLLTDQMTVNSKAISRINKYGDAPACILNRNREIRQYCYCNKYSNTSNPIIIM